MSDKLLNDRYIKIGNINTHYWAAGDEGPVLILIHGLGRSLETWKLNIDALAQKHRVYALDLAGFGRSDKPMVQYSVPYLTQFVRDFLVSQQVDRATIIGNSMGGAIALQMAFSHPEWIHKLILVAPVGFGTELYMGLRLVTVPYIGEIMTRPHHIGARFMLKSIIFDKSLITNEMIDLEFQIAALPGAGNALLATARSFLGIKGVKPKFVNSIVSNVHRLKCPTLVIWGKQDKILPVRQAHHAAHKIPNAKLKLLDECGHTPSLEYSETFNSTVLEFLAG